MPSLNWFNLNRVDGGPSYFGNSNRLSASLYWNDWLFGVVITAAAFITVLLLLSPIYKHQWRTVSLVSKLKHFLFFSLPTTINRWHIGR